MSRKWDAYTTNSSYVLVAEKQGTELIDLGGKSGKEEEITFTKEYLREKDI